MAMPDPALLVASERTVLTGMLDQQRAALRDLVDGLTEAEARARLVPSLTTVLGLLHHGDFVERVWCWCRIGGLSRADAGIGDDIDDSFRVSDDDTIAASVARYDATCERSRAVVAEVDLDEQFDWRGNQVSLRFILAHMIQELAHHAGHGDILREQLLAARGSAE